MKKALDALFNVEVALGSITGFLIGVVLAGPVTVFALKETGTVAPIVQVVIIVGAGLAFGLIGFISGLLAYLHKIVNTTA